jgi:hypothetical protein
MDEENLKLNYIGIFGGVLALISIVLPWISIFVFNLNLLDLVNLTALASALPGVAAVEAIIYGTFALLIIGGIFGLVGGCIAGGKGKSILGVGGVLTILSISFSLLDLVPKVFRSLLSFQLSASGWH